MKRLTKYFAMALLTLPTAGFAQTILPPVGENTIVLPPAALVIPDTVSGISGFYSVVPETQGQTRSVELLNVETPFRCQVDLLDNQKVIATIQLQPSDFKLTYVESMDDLPRYEVNGFSFDETALDEALQKLLEEAEIDVYSEDERFVSLNAKDIYGELAIVVDELTKAGDTYYKYDSRQKRLHISRRGQFEVKLPANRIIMLGVLDALRGAGISTANPNWHTGVITMTLTRAEEKRVRNVLNQIAADGQMLVADTQIYAISSANAGGNWGEIIQTFGADKIYTSNNGLMGKLLSMGHQTNAHALMEAVSQYYRITPISHGMAVVPNGWKMRFDIGRCASSAYAQNPISLLLYPHLRKDGTVDTQVTIDSEKGEMSTFKVNAAVDNELAVIGIPDSSSFGSELLAVMKLKLIRLVGGNKK